MSKNKKGSALVITLLVLLLLVSVTTALLPVSVSSYKSTVHNDDTNRVNLMAESGLQQGLAQIKKNSSLNSISIKSLDNTITCTVTFKDEYKYNTSTSAYESNPLFCTIESYATNGKYSKTMKILLNKVSTTVTTPVTPLVTPPVTPTPTISQVTTAVFGINGVNFIGSQINGDIGTNSTTPSSVKYSWGTLNGTIHIPTGSFPNTVVTGPSGKKTKIPTIKADADVKTYPLPTIPAFPDATTLGLKPDISLKGSNSTTINSNGYYNNITVDANTNINVDTSKGDITLRIGNLNIIQGSITIIGNGKLKLYVDNLISIKGYLNKDRDTKLLELYCNNTNDITFSGETNIFGSFYSDKAGLTLEASGNIRGDIITAAAKITITGGGGAGPRLIYAPNADISLTGGANIKSAIVGKTIYMDGGATVTISTTTPIDVTLPGTPTSDVDTGTETETGTSVTTTTITYNLNSWY